MTHATAVLVNPNSGGGRRNRQLAGRLQSRAGRSAEIIVTQDTQHLQRVAGELASAGTARVGIVGGDGTASDTLSALSRAYGPKRIPQIALLRGGTMNTIANSVGVPRARPTELLDIALNEWAKGEYGAAVAERRTLRIGDRLGFLFGTGVFSNFLREYYRIGHGRPNSRTAAELVTRCALSALSGGETARKMAAAARVSVELDDESWPTLPYLMVGAGTVDQVGLGFRAYHRASERPDAFHVLGITGSPFDVTLDLPRVYRGRGLRPKTGRDGLSRRLTLRSDGAPIEYGLDGELHSTGDTLTVELGPRVSLLASSN